MINRYPIIAIFFVLMSMTYSSSTNAQQLIANGSFETYTSCPTSLSQVTKAVGWRWATTGSSDYYGCTFSGFSSIAGQPSHGSMVMAGYAYTGFGSCTNMYSEMLMTRLTQTLVAGQSYKVSFDLQLDGVGTLTKNPSDCANYGFWFHDSTNTTYPNNQYCSLDTIVPTWEVSFDSLNGKGNYRTFTFTFIATGGENRVILGPFKSAISTTCTTADLMYYNVDNISMEDYCQMVVGPNDTICQGEMATLTVSDPASVWWSTEPNPNDTLGTDTFLNVSPDTSTTYVVHDSLCEMPVRVEVNPIPALEIGADTFICTGDAIFISSPTSPPLVNYLWSDSSILDSLMVTTAGTYYVTLSDSNCSNYDTVTIDETILRIDDLGLDIDVVNCYHLGAVKNVEVLDGKSPYQYFWVNLKGDTISNNQNLTNVFKGSYHLFTKDADGCDITSKDYVVDSMPKIHLEVIKGDTSIWLGDFAQLLITGAPNYEWTPISDLTCEDCPDPEAGPEVTTTFTVRGWDDHTGCDDTLNITVEVDARHIAEVPDLFSPNGDGINDEFIVYFINLENITFEIYNRWGEMVFQTQNQEEFWDGTFNGKGQPIGSYIFRLTAKSKITGEDIHQFGTIGLLR